MLAAKQDVAPPAGSLLTRRRAFAAIAVGAVAGLITLIIPAPPGRLQFGLCCFLKP